MRNLDLFIETFISRRDDLARQRDDGRYRRVGHVFEPYHARHHLAGTYTIGSYVIDERGRCRYAVFDADSDNGLEVLQKLQLTLASDTIPSYLELSRRGGHLWIFFAQPAAAHQVRAWLLPYRPLDVELYPLQDEGNGYGSIIRVPLGIHRRSGKRYPFVVPQHAGPGVVPVAPTVQGSLAWLATIQRVAVPVSLQCNEIARQCNEIAPRAGTLGNREPHTHTSFSLPRMQSPLHQDKLTIREWNALQDPIVFIGRYVQLNSAGVGRCPFSEHHTGKDEHASFKVYRPGAPGGYCWYCYTWKQGGSVFDFLRYYYGLDAQALWERIQTFGQC